MRGVALLLMVLLVTPMLPITSEQSDEPLSSREKSALCFACFSDTHIGARYQYFWLESADHIDDLGDDITEQTGLVDFAVNLGDMVNHNTGHVHGKGLPFFVNQYKNNLKVYHINHIRLPFHCVLGNHDLNDYEKNQDNPHHLIQAIMDETNLNSPCYAMMRDGILFLVMGEMGLVHWTHPVIYEWVECLTRMYSNTTTVILCHQAIEDTTNATTFDRYHGKQDMEYWADLFRRNPQIKLWVHGHNHTPDWYLCNQSSGVSMDPVCFGHPIAFSAPYAQLDMDQSFEEDRIQIYTITKNGIFTAGWEHKKNTGGWTDEQQNQFACVTSFDTNQPDWYSFPLFMQDNQTQKTDMKILSSDIQVQLIGAHPMELFYDSRFQAPPSRNLSYEGILGFGNDQCDQVKWTDPGMAVKGPKTLVFPEKYPHFPFYHEDGRSGPLYHSFPMGTIGAAVPNQRYLITMSGKSMSGCGRVQVRMSCTDWNTRSQYSKLSGSEDIIIDHLLGCEPEIIIGVYQVPDNPSAWFLQGEVMFSDDTWYNISRFSIQQVQTTPITHDFCLNLSGTW